MNEKTYRILVLVLVSLLVVIIAVGTGILRARDATISELELQRDGRDRTIVDLEQRLGLVERNLAESRSRNEDGIRTLEDGIRAAAARPSIYERDKAIIAAIGVALGKLKAGDGNPGP